MNILLVAGLAALSGVLAEGIVLYFFLPMLRETGAVRKNYAGIDIPVSAGISFPLAVLFIYTVLSLASWYDSSYHLFIMGLFAIAFLGFVDDMLGQRDTLGFKGHLGALFRGRLTTGGLKAAGGLLIAFFLALFSSGGWLDLVLNTLLIALFTNMLNLLDLRPGRAIKGFFIFLAIIIVLAGGKVEYLLIAPLLGAVACYFVVDLRANAMMGDSGSNVLGLALGYICVSSLSFHLRGGVLLFLIVMHVLTEKYSLTRIIEQVPLLRFFDELGRRKQDETE